MTLQLITRNIGDGNGGLFPGKFYQDTADSNVSYPAPILYDPNGVMAAALAPLLTQLQSTLMTMRPTITYTETTFSVTTSWTQLVAASSTRKRLIVSDPAGLGVVWSFSSAPSPGQGFTLSVAGAPNVYVFDEPTPGNAVYVKAASAGTLTYATA